MMARHEGGMRRGFSAADWPAATRRGGLVLARLHPRRRLQPTPLPIPGRRFRRFPAHRANRRGRSTAASLEGHIWVADFIYTTCPGPCPMMSSQMRQHCRIRTAGDRRRRSWFPSPSTRRTIRRRCWRPTPRHFKAQAGPLVFPHRRPGRAQRPGPERLSPEQRGWQPDAQHALRAGGPAGGASAATTQTSEDGFLPQLLGDDIRQLERERS